MVKSGLDHRIVEEKREARVSPYRLAAHLTSAFAIYLGLLSGGISILSSPTHPFQIDERILKILRSHSHRIAGLTLLTAIAGKLMRIGSARTVFKVPLWPVSMPDSSTIHSP